MNAGSDSDKEALSELQFPNATTTPLAYLYPNISTRNLLLVF